MIPKLPSPIFLPTLNLFPTTVSEVPRAVSEDGRCPTGAWAGAGDAVFATAEVVAAAIGACDGPGCDIWGGGEGGSKLQKRSRERGEKEGKKERRNEEEVEWGGGWGVGEGGEEIGERK